MPDNPLLKKLRLQPGMRAAIMNAPDGYIASLDLPESVTLSAAPDSRTDFIQVFVRDSAELARYLPGILSQARPDCLLWFCYPKLSSGVPSDLTRDAGWQALYETGRRAIASIAIDETWSGVRFRPAVTQGYAEVIEAQYAGAKAALRPIFDRVLAAVQGFGDDVEVQTRKTYVAFARGRQFAVVQPTTRTRVDVGLKLPGTPMVGRLEPPANTGSGSITHKVALATSDEVDEELIALLRQSYERAG